MISGFITLFIAGFFQGSFGLGYKKYHPFSWPAFWGIYNILCIITSVLFAWICAPELWTVLFSQKPSDILLPILWGSVWGLSAIGFSKAIDKIGMSMVYGISMGISTIAGSLSPMIINKTFPTGISFAFFITGLLLTLSGVGLITLAGVKRDGLVKNSAAGIILAVFSGLGSGAMNTGFTCSENIGNCLLELGYSQIAVSCGKWLPVLVGGCIMGLVWCIGELRVRHEWKTVTANGCLLRTAKLFGVSVIWYLALILYGLSSSMLGSSGTSVGWILFNAFALLVSTAWSLKTGEWKNCRKELLFTGCAVLIISWVFTALS